MDWQQLIQDDWPIVFHIVSQLLFIIFLSVCLWTGVLSCDGGIKKKLASSSGRSQNEIKNLVREVLQPRLETLKILVTEYEVSKLQDGLLEFSTMTEQTEEQLFYEIKSARNELFERQLEHSVEVKRFLKTKFMKHPFDLPGARRLQSILKQYKNCEEFDDYNRGFSKCFDFFCFVSCIFSCVWRKIPSDLPSASLQSNQQPGIFSKCKAGFSFIVFPCFVIAADMFYSDSMVMYELWTYQASLLANNNSSIPADNTTDPTYINIYSNYSAINDTDVFGSRAQDSSSRFLNSMLVILFLIYCFSFLGMLFPSSWSSLCTSYKTGLFMADVSMEKSSNMIPLDSVTRFNLSLDESTSESAMQNAMQWSTYFLIQYAIGRSLLSSNVMKENESFKFNAMWVSGLTSTVSLTLGQMKANKLLTEYQTTGAQKIVYGLACLASTISSQLLLMLFMVTNTDLGMAIVYITDVFASAVLGVVGILILLALTYGRSFLITQKFQGSGALRNKRDRVSAFYSLFFSVQPLHLQTSKTRVVDRRGCWYPGPEYQEWLFRENLVAHIVISFMSMCLLSISHVCCFIQNEPLPFSSIISKARTNFLIIASIFIPVGWILAQGLVRLFLHMDLGGLTCGANFRFEKEGVDALTSETFNLHQKCCTFAHKYKLPFEHKTGRWVEDDDVDETEV